MVLFYQFFQQKFRIFQKKKKLVYLSNIVTHLNAAVEHYNIPIGLLREGDDADFIIVNNLSDFKVEASYIKGEKVSDLEFSLSDECVNRFANRLCSL